MRTPAILAFTLLTCCFATAHVGATARSMAPGGSDGAGIHSLILANNGGLGGVDQHRFNRAGGSAGGAGNGRCDVIAAKSTSYELLMSGGHGAGNGYVAAPSGGHTGGSTSLVFHDEGRTSLLAGGGDSGGIRLAATEQPTCLAGGGDMGGNLASPNISGGHTAGDGTAPASFAAIDGTDEYIVTGFDCHNRRQRVQSMTFSVPKNRKILYIDNIPISGPHNFSFNPDGGYGVWARYYNGRTEVEWRRLHTSSVVKYRVLVHWAWR